MGVGGVGLVVGAVAGGIAIADHSSLVSTCGGSVCPNGKQSDVDSYHTMAVVADIGLIGGAVFLAGGAALALFSPTAADQARAALRGAAPEQMVGGVTPYLGLGTAGVVGRF
jgi:hypothetical protein